MRSPDTSQSPRRTMQHRIAAATVIVMASVFLSRALGFVRDWAIAHLAGAGATTDAYYAAFRLPDFLNYLVAGGSLSITFIPVFAKYAAAGDEEEGWRVFSTVMTAAGIVLIALIALAEIFAGPLMDVFAPGFQPPEHALTVFLTRLTLPAQLFFYQGSILSAVQYAKGRFAIPSLAPLVYNSAVILGGILLYARIGISGFAVGVLGGAICGNFLLQVYGARQAGARYAPNLRVRHPGFVLFLKLSVPIMLALGLTFADDWITTHYASYLVHGAVTWLYYSKTLMRVPLGLVGQALGVASFPMLAQLYSEKKLGELNRVMNGSIKALIVTLLPVSALMMAEGVPLVHLFLTHTGWKPGDYQATAGALVYYSLGLFAWGAQNILARGFYATHNTVVPAVVGTLTTVLSLPIYIWLLHAMQYRGLALASTLGIAAYMVVLFVLLGRRTENPDMGRLVAFFGKVCAASAAVGLVCWKLAQWLDARVALQRPVSALGVLAADTAAGLVLLVVLLRLLGVEELNAYLRRGLGLIGRRRAAAKA